jgi:hypothetical protein
MRAVLASLLVAACATAASDRTPPERVAGCWINRDAGVVSMRGLLDREHEFMLIGSRVNYSLMGTAMSQRYSLQASEAGWSLCEIESGAATRCWVVAQGDGGSLEGGRAFIDAHGDRLRIAILGDGPERVIFYGQRDGCD